MFEFRLALPLENIWPFVLISILKMAAAYSGKSGRTLLVPVINIICIIGTNRQKTLNIDSLQSRSTSH